MRPQGHVLVLVDGASIPGLTLKWRRDGAQALVTYEVDGHVETAWIAAERLLPAPEPPLAAEPVAD